VQQVQKDDGLPSITAEEYASLRKLELSTVQRAVETLIKNGWANGKRGADAQGAVFFSGLDITNSGPKRLSAERERKRKRRILPELREFLGKSAEADRGKEKWRIVVPEQVARLVFRSAWSAIHFPDTFFIQVFLRPPFPADLPRFGLPDEVLQPCDFRLWGHWTGTSFRRNKRGIDDPSPTFSSFRHFPQLRQV